MSSHKTLSRLSIAATAMVFAAIPCFAQTQHDEDVAATSVAATTIQPTVAMNRDLGLKKLIVSDKADERSAPANQPALSPAMFKQEQFSGSFVTFQKVSFEPRADLVKQAGNDNGPAARPLFTFVPSRGQKLPN